MLTKSPTILKLLFPSLIWEVKTERKEIFLTFDDGPNPDITPWVLNCLNSWGAKATFFCVGENVCKYPMVYEQILENGHSVGNHTYNHLMGWKTNDDKYFHNVDKASEHIDSNLFRPPYGRIKPSQIKKLKKDYSLIMWTVLTYDFDRNTSQEKCYSNSISSVKNGSIVVFHDSNKASDNLKYALPKFLEYFSNKGYSFEKL